MGTNGFLFEVGFQIILQIASPWTIVSNVFGCVMLPSGIFLKG